MKKRYFFISFLFVLVLSTFVSLSATTKQECENGNGAWTIPDINASPDEPTKSELNPYCSCEIGFYWNDTLKDCLNDSQLRCIQTQGEWVNNSCQCPEGTIKWTEGFGCDTEGPVPSLNDNLNRPENKEVSYMWFSVILLALILVISLTISLTIKNRRKQNENK